MAMNNPAPLIGKWYARPGGDSFEVVALDPDDATIEIQYFDGTIEELDLDDWREEQIVPAEPPETGPARSTSNPKTTKTSSTPNPASAAMAIISR
jgi:hypothetical protein